MKKAWFPMFLILCLFYSAFGQQPDWYKKLLKIQMLQSTKGEVEEIFENPKIDKSFIDGGIQAVYYETTEGKFSVMYSSGDCSFGRTNDFNVEKGKLIYFIYFPKNWRVKLSKFSIDKKQFEMRKEHEGTLYYSNKDLGIEFGTQREMVIHIELVPSSKFEYLRCIGQLNNKNSSLNFFNEILQLN